MNDLHLPNLLINNKNAILLTLIAILVLTGCARVTTKGPTTLTNPPMQITGLDRENAALAFISYSGNELEYSDEVVDSLLYWCIKNELKIQPLTKDKYELIWGPAVFKFQDAILDDNMMYVVRRIGTNQMVVAIRGTNFASISDWLAEDLNVIHSVPWDVPEKNRSHAPKSLRISQATDTGLKILQTLVPKLPGVPGKTVREFLAEAVKADSLDQVSLVGHSLGGALAPAFALWLSDTRPQWDPKASAGIAVTTFAGPSGGNRAYSTYYDSQLGRSTKRIYNPYDAIPLAWNETTLKSLPGLYVPDGIEANGPTRFLIRKALNLVKGKDYMQILPDAPSLTGGVIKTQEMKSYLKQVAWQHQCGYYCALNIQQGSPVPLNPLQSCAGGNTPAACDVCPPQTP